jgi:fibronectin type 3 domain-containing protein
MKRLVAVCLIVGGCLNLSFAQGMQGNVKLTGQATVITSGHSVTLSWAATPGAASYSIYCGTTHGQYLKKASGILTTGYTDLQVTHSQTLYYVITAVSGGNESSYSNETVAVIP